MRVLITGASGFLGSRLYSIFSSDLKNSVVGTYNNHPHPLYKFTKMDVTDREQTIRIIQKLKPDAVIHTVALSDPDYCEEYPELAFKVNYEGTKNVADACVEINTRLHHISTIYVFDGSSKFYNEKMEPNAKGSYGRSKLEAEKAVQRLHRYSIYRTDKMVGFSGHMADSGYLSKILRGNHLTVNADQFAHPIFIDDIGRAILKMQELEENGVLHLAGPERMKKLDIALGLARLVGKESLVSGISANKQKSPRPDISIDTAKAKSLGLNFTPIPQAYGFIKDQLLEMGY